MKVAADGRLYVTDIVAGGIHVLAPDGRAEAFIACGTATTNCVFAGETLWVTNAGVLATSAEPSFAGTLVRLHGAGRRRADALRGRIAPESANRREATPRRCDKRLFSVAEVRAAARRHACPGRCSTSPTAAPRTSGRCAATRRPSATSSCCRAR